MSETSAKTTTYDRVAFWTAVSLSWVDAVGDKSRFASGETDLYMGSIIYIVFIQISLHLVIRGIGYSDFFFRSSKTSWS